MGRKRSAVHFLPCFMQFHAAEYVRMLDTQAHDAPHGCAIDQEADADFSGGR